MFIIFFSHPLSHEKSIGGGVREGDSPQINVPFQIPASFSIPGNRSKLMKSV